MYRFRTRRRSDRRFHLFHLAIAIQIKLYRCLEIRTRERIDQIIHAFAMPIAPRENDLDRQGMRFQIHRFYGNRRARIRNHDIMAQAIPDKFLQKILHIRRNADDHRRMLKIATNKMLNYLWRSQAHPFKPTPVNMGDILFATSPQAKTYQVLAKKTSIKGCMNLKKRSRRRI